MLTTPSLRRALHYYRTIGPRGLCTHAEFIARLRTHVRHLADVLTPPRGPGHNGNRAARRAYGLLLKKLSPQDQRILDDYISTILRSALKSKSKTP